MVSSLTTDCYLQTWVLDLLCPLRMRFSTNLSSKVVSEDYKRFSRKPWIVILKPRIVIDKPRIMIYYPKFLV